METSDAWPILFPTSLCCYCCFQRSGSQALNFLHFLAFALKLCDKGLLSVGGVFGRGGGLHETLLTCSNSILFLTAFVFNALRE